MLNNGVSILLTLTKSALTNSTSSLPTDNINWQSLYPLAIHQGITAILLDTISKLPNEAQPSKPMLLQWIGQATMMERMYAKHREKIEIGRAHV